MKFPQKFAMVLLPVTLLHLVAITLFGVVMRIHEANHPEDSIHHFADSGVEAPQHDHRHGDGKVIDSTLFPKLESASGIPDHDDPHHAEPPRANPEPEPITPKTLGNNLETSAKEKPAEPRDNTAQPRRDESNSSRKIRGFRPIGVKKST